MSFQIRQAITANVKGQSPQEFTDIVEDAIERGEEHLLPGLGVFLEKWWTTASEEQRNLFSQQLSQQFS